MTEQFSIIGKRLPRKDAAAKVRGNIRFVSDIQLAGMLYAKFLRSPHAHAKIISIDTSRAGDLSGVYAVLTHKNVPKVHPRGKLETLLDEEVHYPGEEVAAVAAVDEATAEEALKLIDVQYQVLPAVFDIFEAMKPGAPLVHPEYGGNMFHGSALQPVPRCKPDGWLTISEGDVEKGFAEADEVIEGDYESAIQHNCSPLPRSVVCQWSGEELTCWADTQIPMDVHQDLAQCLGMAQSNVRVIARDNVGGYGAKEPEKTGVLVALMARMTGRPVKATFSREEDLVATRTRGNYKTHHKIGVKKDGTITAIHSRFVTNMGRDNVYAFQYPTTSCLNTGNILYEWKASQADACTIMTNVQDCTCMNAFGDAEAGFTMERLIDEAAERIGMSPVEFRRKNCMKYGDKAQKYFGLMFLPPEAPIPWGVLGDDIGFPECIDLAVEKSGWKEKWKGWRTPVAVNGPRRRGIGIAIGTHHTAYMLYSATVKMNPDGTAVIFSSGSELGQGFATALAQVVAETLGLRYEDVNLVLGELPITPPGFGNYSSGGVTSGVTAAWYAAQDARKKLLDVAAKRLAASPDQLETRDRRVYIKGRSQPSIPIAELCQDPLPITGQGALKPMSELIDEKSGKIIWPFAVVATVSEVEVDTETGQLDVIQITSAHDVGKALNPQIVENQINMSSTLANGWVRSEEYIIDKKTGAMLNANMLDYKIMTMLDMPPMGNRHEIIVEKPTIFGAFGSKGFSETAMVSGGPAIANAVYNAIGVRMRGEHLTPDRILESLGRIR